MSTFVKMLPLELQEIQEYQEPKQDIEEHDHIVGDMSDDLKRLWTLWKVTQYKAGEAELQLRFSQDTNFALVYEMQSKSHALEIIFWIAINDEFGLWERHNVGVRKGYKVVWTDEQKPQLPPFLHRLFDGGL